jgi:hypothetical protein
MSTRSQDCQFSPSSAPGDPSRRRVRGFDRRPLNSGGKYGLIGPGLLVAERRARRGVSPCAKRMQRCSTTHSRRRDARPGARRRPVHPIAGRSAELGPGRPAAGGPGRAPVPPRGRDGLPVRHDTACTSGSDARRCNADQLLARGRSVMALLLSSWKTRISGLTGATSGCTAFVPVYTRFARS